MSDSEDDGLSFESNTKTLRESRFSLGQLSFGSYRRKSVGQAPSHPVHLRNENEYAIPDQDELIEQSQTQTRVTRSRSNADVLDCKEQWSSGLLAQRSMQEAWIKLRNDAAAHERQASDERWADLLLARADVSELSTFAQDAQEQKQKPGKVRKGFDEFCTVALEYSKLLDVVMNQSPEYASLAWGIMKVLLFANINHAKLRTNIRTYLIEIGNQLGLVNQLLLCSPTETMVEAVALLYATFSKFLGKALRCYAKSKFMVVANAFTNPWDRKFQPLIENISQQFCRIQHLAHASHFRETLHSQSLLRDILKCHDRLATQQFPSEKENHSDMKEQLRAEVKNEMREEMLHQMSEMFSVFETRWPQRFEDMMGKKLQDTPLKQAACPEPGSDWLPPKPTSHQSTASKDFLAANIATPEEILVLRDKAFPSLQNVDSTESYLRIRNRRLRAFEYNCCATMLKREETRHWMTDASSGLLWIESYSDSRFTDWMTALVLDLIDQASRFEHNTVLRYFSQSRMIGQGISTAVITLQSLIFQLIQRHRQDLATSKNRVLTKRFHDSENDFERLWQLFVDVLKAGQCPCLWIILDHIGSSKQGSNNDPNMTKLLRYLDGLACSEDLVVKVLITARLTGKRLSSDILDETLLAPQHSIISMPRGCGATNRTPLTRLKAHVPAATKIREKIAQSSPALHLSAFDHREDSSAQTTDNERPTNTRIRAIKVQQQVDTDNSELELPGRDLWTGASSDDVSSDEERSTAQSTASEDSLVDNSPMQETPTTEPFPGFASVINWQSERDELDEKEWGAASPLTPKIAIFTPECSPKSSVSRSRSPVDDFARTDQTEPKALPLLPIDVVETKKQEAAWDKINANDSDESDDSSNYGL